MHNRIAFVNNIGKTKIRKGENMKKNLFGTLGQFIRGNAVIIILAVATVAAETFRSFWKALAAVMAAAQRTRL